MLIDRLRFSMIKFQCSLRNLKAFKDWTNVRYNLLRPIDSNFNAEIFIFNVPNLIEFIVLFNDIDIGQQNSLDRDSQIKVENWWLKIRKK